MKEEKYNRQAAIEYGAKYALHYNPAYGSWASAGGDCANFVSQCLYAGGMPMKRSGARQWYYNTPGQKYTAASSSWKGAQSLRVFLKYNKEVPYLSIQFLNSSNGLQPGDIVWALNDDGTTKAARTAHHVALVDHVDGNGGVYIHGHTADKCNALWSYPKKDTLYGKLDDIIIVHDSQPDLSDSAIDSVRELRYALNAPLMAGEDVMRVQRALLALGYNPGSIDGKYGPQTCRAVRAYQAEKDVLEDMIVGQATYMLLGMVSKGG